MNKKKKYKDVMLGEISGKEPSEYWQMHCWLKNLRSFLNTPP